jgi:uncharacterized membrane protein
MAKATEVTCQICGKQYSADEMIPGGAIREALVAEIRQAQPDWTDAGYICHDDLDAFRAQYVKNSLQREKGELTELDHAVLKSMKEEETLARDVNREFDGGMTFGQRVADKVAEFGGSWRFIISFCVFLVVWMVVNSIALLRKPFDPFPFILLNLMLSGVAGLQAPVIMMSQNRQESKDRLRAEHDYQVNLKAELEIRNLHEKIDHLLNTQWQRLLEIQQIQTDLMEELTRANGGNGKKGAEK